MAAKALVALFGVLVAFAPGGEAGDPKWGRLNSYASGDCSGTVYKEGYTLMDQCIMEYVGGATVFSKYTCNGDTVTGKYYSDSSCSTAKAGVNELTFTKTCAAMSSGGSIKIDTCDHTGPLYKVKVYLGQGCESSAQVYEDYVTPGTGSCVPNTDTITVPESRKIEKDGSKVTVGYYTGLECSGTAVITLEYTCDKCLQYDVAGLFSAKLDCASADIDGAWPARTPGLGLTLSLLLGLVAVGAAQ